MECGHGIWDGAIERGDELEGVVGGVADAGERVDAEREGVDVVHLNGWREAEREEVATEEEG